MRKFLFSAITGILALTSIAVLPVSGKAKLAGSSFWFFVPSTSSYSEAMAWDFDGTNDYIRVPHHADFNITDNLSVEMLVQLDAGTTFYQLFTKRSNDGSDLVFQTYVNNTNGHWVVNIVGDTAGTKTYRWGTAIDDGVKRQLGFTFASGTLTLLVNGVTVAVNKDVDNSFTALKTNSADFGIGANPTTESSPTNGLAGRILMWDTAVLIENEYAALWGGGTPISPLANSGNYTSSADLVVALLMESNDTAAGSGVLDASGNAHHGSITNMDIGDLVAW